METAQDPLPGWREAILEATERYHCREFIENDPIQIPHSCTRRVDIEVAGFFTALLSWGNRTTIIGKSRELMRRMDGMPGDFVRSSSEREWASLQGFVHRTFQDTDLLFLADFLRRHYRCYESMEDAFLSAEGPNVAFEGRQRLQAFHDRVFALEWAPMRTRKHVPSPARGSRCKRLNMFLRWMVRRDPLGVDFGLWQRISPASLMMPVDVHVERVALQWRLLTGRERGWHAVEALTAFMRMLDPEDPVRFDYGLFSLGVENRSAGVRLK
ncbi:MAG: TIGR02757 family protein [Sphingomonadales bacterium]|nr:TIGR02757 family protein [Sphingomonadales bacterium]